MAIPTNKSIKTVRFNGTSIPLYGAVPSTITAGDTPIIVVTDIYNAERAATPLESNISLTITKSGTYRFKTMAFNTHSSSSAFSNTSQVQFYKNGTAYGTARILDGEEALTYSQDITCAVGDTITVYASSASSSSHTIVSGLIACIDWNNGF